MRSTLLIAVFAVVAAAATFAGGVMATLPGRLSKRQLSLIIGFGAGYILAAALVSLMPESLALVSNAPLWILVGYALAHLFEHTFTSHFHFGEETHAEHFIAPHVSTTALVGLSLHAFFDGVAISSGFLVTPALGVLIALAVVLHKIPEGVAISSIFLAAGASRARAVAAATALAIATLLGVTFTGLFEPLAEHGLALAAGVTLYVGASNLVPEFQAKPGWRLPVAFFAGCGIYLLARQMLPG